jgi:hypothetical protein
VLIGCRRLLHKGTKEIRYSPDAALQLIVGMNGYGKSTVLEYLSPLPPSPKEFVKGGSKEIVIRHQNGSTYRLVSDFSKGNLHYFFKDGIDLNDGHTLTIQKHLVQEHFGYTPEIHQLCTGKVKLTRLSVQKRKEWLVKLCQTDVTYVLGLYSRLAQSFRKLTASKEHAETKLLDLKSKLIAAEEFESLMDQIKAIGEMDHEIIQSIGFVDWTTSIDNHYKSLESRLIDSSTLLMKSMPKTRLYKSMAELTYNHSVLASNRSDKEQSITASKERYEAISEAINRISTAGDQTLSELITEASDLKFKISQYHPETIEDARLPLTSMISDIYSVRDSLNNLLLKLPLNPSMALYNRSTISAKRDEYASLRKLKDVATNSISSAEARIKEFQSHNAITCVNCNHKWVPGFEEKELQMLRRRIKTSEKEVEELTIKLAELTEWLQGSELWVAEYRKYTAMYEAYPRLSAFFDTLQDEMAIFDRPSSLLNHCDNYLHRLTVAAEYLNVKDRLDLVEHVISQKQLMENENVSTLTEKLNEIISSIESESIELDKLKLEERNVYDYMDSVKRVHSIAKDVSQLFVEYDNLTIDLCRHRTNNDLKRLLKENSDKVRSMNDRISEARSGQSIAEHLKQDIYELDSNIKVTEILLKELSPTEGMIADTLGGFGLALASQLNTIIDHVWSTPLSIKACNVKDGDLDYQFPLTSSEDVEDISLGSDGEMELIDFAWMMIARIYLKCDHFPLMLDEVGGKFHDEHKLSLFKYVKSLVENGLVSQVFIVSHSPTIHSTLVHADLNVIDPSGVLVTPDANKYFHVV